MHVRLFVLSSEACIEPNEAISLTIKQFPIFQFPFLIFLRQLDVYLFILHHFYFYVLILFILYQDYFDFSLAFHCCNMTLANKKKRIDLVFPVVLMDSSFILINLFICPRIINYLLFFLVLKFKSGKCIFDPI